MRKSNEPLITIDDVLKFVDEVNHGHLMDRVLELVEQEPELAFFVSERYSKTLDSLKEAGIDVVRLAALQKNISLMIWGSAILVSRAQRRHWDELLPSEETIEEGGEK